MVYDVTAIVAILLLAAVTFATRIGGVWIMSFVTISPRIEAFLSAMATSVLVAIVVPATVAGTHRLWLAVAAAVLVTVATRSYLAGMIAGVALAAVAKLFGM